MSAPQIAIVLAILAVGIYLCAVACFGEDGLFRD